MTILEQRSKAATPALPVAVPAMAGIEMWERFSFYGMQAILAYYLYGAATSSATGRTSHPGGGLGMSTADATALVGAYGALLYVCTFIGGWVADRLLGAEKTLLTGAGLLMAGHVSLSLIPGYAGLALGLVPIALGSGLLKTAAITILGAAFPATTTDGRRDAAFQIFYLGINIGALLGPLLTGYLSTRFGFHVGFGAAAVLMAIGCVMYAFLRPRLRASAAGLLHAGPTAPLTSAQRRRAAAVVAVLLLVLAWALGSGRLTPQLMARAILALALGISAYLIVSMLVSPAVTAAERRRVISFVPLLACSATYWTLQSQSYGVLAVYSDVRLDRTVAGFEIPAAWTQSLNPAFTLILLPLCAALFTRLGPRTPRPHTLMGVGVIIAGLGMLTLLPFAGGDANSTPFLVLAGCILLWTIGEVLIGPIGMAASTEHAPRAFATRFSALYFLTLAIGTSLAGSISPLFNPEDADAEATYIVAVSAVPLALGVCVLVGLLIRRRYR